MSDPADTSPPETPAPQAPRSDPQAFQLRGETCRLVEDWRDEIDPCRRSAVAGDDLDPGARPHFPGIRRGQGQRDRNAGEVRDAKQLGVRGHGLTERHVSGYNLSGDRSGDGNAVECTAAAASRCDLLLGKPQGNPGFGRSRACGDQILFGRNPLIEQPLLAAQVRFRKRQPNARIGNRKVCVGSGERQCAFRNGHKVWAIGGGQTVESSHIKSSRYRLPDPATEI